LPEAGGLKVAVLDLLDKVEGKTGKLVPAHPEGYKGGNHLWSAEKRLIRLQSARDAEKLNWQYEHHVMKGKLLDILPKKTIVGPEDWKLDPEFVKQFKAKGEKAMLGRPAITRNVTVQRSAGPVRQSPGAEDVLCEVAARDQAIDKRGIADYTLR
jgi:hypothetical protein